ncbi:hypothetical protein EOD41_06045 [Mucilaginibacter limnophilus]|uniref:DUF5683 domain-containing protein n=1 Tax=Mucilaginibacter limnophilus TaxID=1932778 RepID=A0A3S2Y1W1_9SPHI|nr:DUF5683 domain-containing protein [Mucilaginibacter limnophilus]RVU01525.1 hypothetical protein EOD41_06045 [Mucilaginibacter limnophilus]
MYKRLFLICFITVCCFAVKAQDADTSAVKPAIDSTTIKEDAKKSPAFVPKITKERKYNPDSTHSPRKAVMHSLMIPGWGQVYNKKWWKVPVIYTGLGLLGAAIVFNQKNYNETLAIAKYRQRGIQPSPGDRYYDKYQLYAENNVSDAYINNAVDLYRRNRDLSILGVLGAWGIQMIDAYVDAKFIHSYTMDNDLSFKISPGLIDQPMYAGSFNGPYIPGIKVTFAF